MLRTCQVVPFHCSASVRVFGAGEVGMVEYEPTAMHADPRQQETLNKTRADLPGCAGVSCRHVLPFHACADAGLEP